MSIGSTTAHIASPPPKDWLRPGALARLLDPSPAWVTGLSWDFQQRNYGRSYCEVARAKREGEQ